MIRFVSVENRRSIFGHLLWFLTWAAVTVIAAFLLRPSSSGHGTHTQLGLAPCPSVILFDRPCFGCGMTTSFTATIHGDLPAAWRAHKLGTAAYVLFSLSAFVALVSFLRAVRVDTSSKRFTQAMMVLAALFVVHGVARFAAVTYDSPAHILHKRTAELAK